MKIIQISPYFPPHVGGVEYHVKELADGLSRRGHCVSVASSCGRWTGELVSIPSIDLFYSPIPIKLPKFQADVFHSHTPSPLFAFMFRGESPHVVTYHNDVVIPEKVNGHSMPRPFAASLERINERMVRPVLDGAEIVIATTKSYASTSIVLKDYLHKLKIVPNAVNVSLYPQGRKKGNYVVYAGRMISYKGVETLIFAMSEVQKRANLELLLIGDGYDKSRLEELARRLHVRAKFTGRLERSMFIDTISRAEVLILPTQNRLEAFGIVLLEAMACETPVLAYNTPGVNEVALNGGMVYSSMEELCELILELHENELQRERLGVGGRKAVEDKYSWKRALDCMESIYQEVA
ncbi:MAG: UDP-D-galactose:(glucosyl)lipopolysaccharide-1,6-D-galactosyltransferase [Methanosaeta sp. PtaU1.Bin112]|nr:MAG: UDP-D-galactose:(glucosyl)lipopolysaccharide-1,6-D-galactosyltransferase [Methanosaeta sp. PtaU1.Bin112]